MIHVANDKSFHLYTKSTSYILRPLVSGHLGHLYYGKRIREKANYDSLYNNYSMSLGCHTDYSRETDHLSLETSKLEVSTYGKGDYREPSLMINIDGIRTTDFKYQSYEIYDGKRSLDGLPATFVNGDKVKTIEIKLYDEVYDISLYLAYSVFYDRDVISRSMRIENGSKQAINVEKVMSMNLDFHCKDFDILTLDGQWIKERHVHKRPVTHGQFVIDSKKGVSSADHNPFVALLSKDCTETRGQAYGFALVYSGNHYTNVQYNAIELTRVQMGINAFDFNWRLSQEESFQSPEVLLTFSDQGLNGMSQNYHGIIENNLVSKQWQFKSRPILLNNWEATYFDFDERKLLNLAKEAKKAGIELFVLDDGWFGKRDNDRTSLGDWYEDKKKLPNGLEGLSKKIKNLGLDFGLWVEPEMVSVESELYKKHPEWAITLPNRQPSFGRHQLMLDMANDQVIDYLFKILSDVFTRSQVSYVKWDMNRNISDVYSNVLANKQKEHGHRYVLGLYKLLNDLTKAFPHILFESCASGGNRFDLGMLYYMPQTWTSDNTDAMERVSIQYGTSLVYPPSTMGAHVSDSPSHQVLRNTAIETRFNVAAFGLLGYELDLTKATPFEKNVIKEQIAYYKKHRRLLQFGDFYRLESPFEGNVTKWMMVSKDQTEAMAGYYQMLQKPGPGLETYEMIGLNRDFKYHVSSRIMSFNIKTFGNLINNVSPVKIKAGGIVHTLVSNRYQFKSEKEEVESFGDELMFAGMQLKHQFTGTGYTDQVRFIGDFGSRIYHLRKL